jgi:hypothetical protein
MMKRFQLSYCRLLS